MWSFSQKAMEGKITGVYTGIVEKFPHMISL